MQKIFIVEDDQAIIRALQVGLKKWNYQTQTVTDWGNITTEILTAQPDLVIMDITLPMFDGFYWTGKLRESSQLPVIFLSAAELDPNAVRALALGADDYIVKPFSVNVLVSKIQAIFRRMKLNQTEINELSFENYHLNILTNSLTIGSEYVKLTPTEGVILKLLFLNAGKLVGKKQLMNELWQGGSFVDEGVLNVNISRLRKKLSSLKLAEQLITERKKGYRLVEKDDKK